MALPGVPTGVRTGERYDRVLEAIGEDELVTVMDLYERLPDMPRGSVRGFVWRAVKSGFLEKVQIGKKRMTMYKGITQPLYAVRWKR